MTVVVPFPVLIFVISFRRFKVSLCLVLKELVTLPFVHLGLFGQELGLSYRFLFMEITVLYLYVTSILYISPIFSIQFTQPFTDVLNKDIKVSCRWWSGFDLLRRLLFIVVVFFFNYVKPSYIQVKHTSKLRHQLYLKWHLCICVCRMKWKILCNFKIRKQLASRCSSCPGQKFKLSLQGWL